MYVGFTNKFPKRLSEHNSGGCRTTGTHKDWVLRAYVCGFLNNVLLVREFEAVVQHHQRVRVGLMDTLQILYTTIAMFRERGTVGCERLQVRVVPRA